jgi:protein-S-isoprenylcysteine O-methyltransferase Ste14
MASAERQSRSVPAPLLVVFCLGAGWTAHHFYPRPFLPDLGVLAPALATLLCAAALLIGVAGVREFHRHNTPTSPYATATVLVTSGIFRYTRNPMYLGLVLLGLGLATATNALWLLVATVVLAALLDRAVINPEDRILSARFGDTYAEYARRTRRRL